MLNYRPEIDGLRAIAVLPVLFFHAQFSMFSGGYIGVDIFFVISGYLITSIILKDLSAGTFSLTRFYERRALRILPALVLVVLVCIPFALVLLNAASMKDFTQSIFAVATFSSNILFWTESSYFDAAAELKPLLHTWSLAVEEQFYILFPLFLLAFWYRGRRFILLALTLCFFASLAIAQRMLDADSSAAFYLLPFRAWELLIGVFCAFYLSGKSICANGIKDNLASAIGLLLIAYSIVMFDQSTRIPGLDGLVPTIGAALVILYANPGTLVHRILSSKGFVGIGLISYSTYLWHQPVLAYARLASLKELSGVHTALLLVMSILLAYFSWKYVEQPFRKSNFLKRKTVLPLAFSCLAGLSLVGVVGQLKNGQFGPANRYAPNIEWASFGDMVRTNGLTCETEKVPNTNWILGCYFGNQSATKTVVVYGDSHGQSISFPLDDHFKSNDTRGMMVRVEGCDLVPFTRSGKNRAVTNCAERIEELYSYIKQNNLDVIVTSRWTQRLYPIDGLDLDMPYRNSDGYVEIANKRDYSMLIGVKFYSDVNVKRTFLSKFLTDLSAASNRLFLVYPVPETGIDIERLNRFHYQKTGELLEHISTPFSDYQARNAFVQNTFDTLPDSNIVRIRPDQLFCQNYLKDKCVMQWDSIPFYYDDNHLSYQGAKLLVDEIVRELLPQES